MCGIIGSRNALKIGNRKKALNFLRLRGPENEGEYFDMDNNVWLGHTRLSIQDLSENGNQPMSIGPDHNLIITFNGEIYNSIQLRENLIKRGKTFRGNSDTEVLLHAYDCWGLEMFSFIEGMYAFAIWDKQKKQMILARDPIGQKPLFYYLSPNNEVYFASNLQALREILPFSPTLSKKSFAYILTLGYLPNSASIYDEIQSLHQGHHLTIKDEISELKEYWSVKNIPYSRSSLESKISTFQPLFKKVCKEHLISDVPLGLLLSGGLDSSTIAYFLRKSKSITSYSLHFGSYDKEESIIAEKSAKYLGLSHQDIEMHFSDIDDLRTKVATFSSQPQAFSSLLAWYCASLEISKFTKVVISGDGGDEVFGGYKWYTKRTLKETILNSYRSCKNPLDFEFFKLSLKSPLHRHWMLHTPRFLPSECCNLLGINKDIFDENAIISHFKRYFQPELPLIDALRRVDLMTFCSDHICRKTDEMSMAHSLEVRAPFLDRRIVEFGLSHRSKEYKDKKSKQILRNLLASKMPREVSEMSKRGFSSNLSNYNYAQLINEIKNSKIVKDEFIEKRFENILETSSNFKNIRLFTLASLSKWYELHT